MHTFRKPLLLVFILGGVLFSVSHGLAASAVKLKIHRKLNLQAAPADIALSADNQKLYVLTETGNLQIYSNATGSLAGTVEVGLHIDRIEAGPREDVLILASRKNTEVQIVTLEFVQDIDISGAPFKGPADAPVTVVVFSDFQ